MAIDEHSGVEVPGINFEERARRLVDMWITDSRIKFEESVALAKLLRMESMIVGEFKQVASEAKHYKQGQDVMALAVKEAREALDFFAEPYTWSRVWADAVHAPISSGLLNNMYGEKARDALKKLDEILGSA